MNTFNAPAGRSFRASNTKAGSMMLRGSRGRSSYMDYCLLALIHNPLLTARLRKGLLFRLLLPLPLGCHCHLLRALWLSRFALGWRRFKTGARRYVEAEHRREILASQTLVCRRRLLRSEEHTSELQSLRHLVC